MNINKIQTINNEIKLKFDKVINDLNLISRIWCTSIFNEYYIYDFHEFGEFTWSEMSIRLYYKKKLKNLNDYEEHFKKKITSDIILNIIYNPCDYNELDEQDYEYNFTKLQC